MVDMALHTPCLGLPRVQGAQLGLGQHSWVLGRRVLLGEGAPLPRDPRAPPTSALPSCTPALCSEQDGRRRVGRAKGHRVREPVGGRQDRRSGRLHVQGLVAAAASWSCRGGCRGSPVQGLEGIAMGDRNICVPLCLGGRPESAPSCLPSDGFIWWWKLPGSSHCPGLCSMVVIPKKCSLGCAPRIVLPRPVLWGPWRQF